MRSILGRFITLAAGLVMLYFGCRTFSTNWRLKHHGQVATGRVTEYACTLSRSEDSPSRRVYAPVAEYKVGDHVYRIRSPQYSERPDLQVGVQVRVLYDPKDPGDGRFDTMDELWSLPLILNGFGLVMTVAALFWRASR
jgi:hypothetical protein